MAKAFILIYSGTIFNHYRRLTLLVIYGYYFWDSVVIHFLMATAFILVIRLQHSAIIASRHFCHLCLTFLKLSVATLSIVFS